MPRQPWPCSLHPPCKPPSIQAPIMAALPRTRGNLGHSLAGQVSVVLGGQRHAAQVHSQDGRARLLVWQRHHHLNKRARAGEGFMTAASSAPPGCAASSTVQGSVSSAPAILLPPQTLPHLARQAARPQQRRIQHVWPVGRRKQQHAWAALETVQLWEGQTVGTMRARAQGSSAEGGCMPRSASHTWCWRLSRSRSMWLP